MVAALLAVGGAAFAWVFWFAGGSGEPTTELTTPELATTTTTTSVGSTSTSVAEASSGPLAFVIDQADSIASFEIDEVLRGTPTHVVGTTDQLVGQVLLDPNDLSSIQISEIVINARTLTTGSDRRDRAIRGPIILDSGSDQHELISFTVTEVSGLPGSAEIGSEVSFMVEGQLTIKGATNLVGFEVIAELADEVTLIGSATATVLRSGFGIGIPTVQGVADVTDEVLLNLEFVARAG